MLSSKDRYNLVRHLKSAGQLLKKRESAWEITSSAVNNQRIEQKLFVSFSLLSDYAENFLMTDWPEKPIVQKVALISILQSKQLNVFSWGLNKLLELIISDDGDYYLPALWLAIPGDLSKEQINALLESDILSHIELASWYQLNWSEETIRHLALQASLPLPAWIGANEQLKHTPEQAVLRKLTTNQPNANRELLNLLADSPAEAPSWSWLTLCECDASLKLFAKHGDQNPEALKLFSLNGSSQVIDYLIESLSRPMLAESASWALEQTLGQTIVWHPVISDAQSGKTVDHAPEMPIAPVKIKQEFSLLQGEFKTATVLARWMLSQPATMQSIAWQHLAKSRETTLPDLSRHWTHVSLGALARILPKSSKVDHAA
ncbi:hypothetical protein KO489_00430 [Reinekea forsetii]|nr:hypothetical protein [Reinekea forsetii]